MSLFTSPGKRRETLKSANGKRTFVPSLELLEDRTVLSTLIVTSTADSGPGTLRDQLAAAKNGDTIDFKIGSPGTLQTININSTLTLTNQVVIDGTSQPGYNGTPLISIKGNANVPNLFSLFSGSSGSTIQGLDMFDYTNEAVGIFSPGNIIQNNWIGFFHDPTTGQVHLNYNLGSNFNQTVGIGVLASNNNVIRNNVIDGTGTGIGVGGNGGTPGNPPVTPAVNNSIVDNFIGTDPTGTTAVGYGNQKDGIYLGQACENTVIAGNVISGNTANGIEMQLDNLGHRLVFPGYNSISGNKIGTDANGSYAIPNGTGITIFGAMALNTIKDNLISGNLKVGIAVGLANYGPGTANTIQGNIIGLNASQTAVISPGNYGIFFTNGSTENHVQGNVIAGAKLVGVLSDYNTSGNYVTGNWIGQSAYGQSFPNGYYGVELLTGSWYNSVLQNSFGPNGIGSVSVGANTNWNSIGYTPQITPSSFLAQIQIMVDYYALMVQQLVLSNPSGFFDALQNCVYFAGIVETEIINTLLRS